MDTRRPPDALLRRSKLLADIGSSFVTRVLLLPMALASSLIVTRGLGPENKGVYTTATTFATLAVAIGSLSFGRAATYHLARGTGNLGAIRHAARWMSIANGVVVMSFVVVTGLFLTPSLFPNVPRVAFLLAAPLAMLTIVRGAYEGFLRGAHRNHAVNVLQVILAASFLALLVPMVAVGGLSTNEAITAKVGAAVVASLLAVSFARRRLPTWGLRGRFDRKAARTLIAFALPYTAVVITQNLSYRADILLVQAMKGNAAVGYYSVAVTIAELLWVLPMAVGFVVFPRSAAQGAATAGREVAALLRWTFSVTVVAAAALAATAGWLVPLLFGGAFGPAVAPARLLIVGAAANCWYQVLSGHLIAGRRLRQVALASLGGALLNVTLNVALIPRWGILGSAAASAVSYSLTGGILLLLFLRHHDGPLMHVLVPSPRELAAVWLRLRSRVTAQPEKANR